MAAFAGAPDQSRIDGLRAEIAQTIAQIERETPRARVYDTKKLIAVYAELARIRSVVSRLLNEFIEPSPYARHEDRQRAWQITRDRYQASFEKMRPYRDIITAARAVLTDTVTALDASTKAGQMARAMAAAGGAPAQLALPGDDFRDRVIAELKAADATLKDTTIVRWMYGTGAAGNWIDDIGGAVQAIGRLMVDLAKTAVAVTGGVLSAIRWFARNWWIPVGGYVGWQVYQDHKRNPPRTA